MKARWILKLSSAQKESFGKREWKDNRKFGKHFASRWRIKILVNSSEDLGQVLSAQGVFLVRGSIQITFDENKRRYELPLFVIHRPTRQAESRAADLLSDSAVPGKMIRFSICFQGKKETVEIASEDPPESIFAVAKDLVKKVDGDFDESVAKIKLVCNGSLLPSNVAIGATLKENALVYVFKVGVV